MFVRLGALLGALALAIPATAGASGVPDNGNSGPSALITYNASDVTLGGLFRNDVTVVRGAATVATGHFAGDPSSSEFGVNSPFLGGLGTGCWDIFTPQILPGDVVRLGASDAVTIPEMTAQRPVVENGAVVVRGTVGADVNFALLDVQLRPSDGSRFSGIGTSGGQLLSARDPRGFTVSFGPDPGDDTHWTARFSGLGDQLATAAAADARLRWDNDLPGAPTPPVNYMVDYAAGATAGPVAACPTPYRPNEATAVGRRAINVATSGDDLTVRGVSQPGTSVTGVSLRDAAGHSVDVPATGSGLWSVTVPGSALAALDDGPVAIASTYGVGAGRTATGLLVKDTVAPAAPAADVAPGTYTAARDVTLAAADGTVHYTTDGSAPTASSPAATAAVHVDRSQTIKAVAVDAAGNVSPVASFAYVLNGPRPDTTITSGPQGETDAADASFAFQASLDGASFECRLDAGPWAPCTSPQDVTVTAGDHTFAVRGLGPLGNPDPTPAERSWTVTGAAVADPAPQQQQQQPQSPAPQPPAPVSGTAPSESAPVPPAGPVGVSIDGGARYTNSAKVAVDAIWPLGARTLTLSNDGGFHGAATRDIAAHVDWTLDSSGPERLPKTIYVRFGASSQTFTDDIILDETPPALTGATFAPSAASAAAAKRTVVLKARDQTSGVRSVQAAAKRGRAAKTLRYAKRVRVPSTARVIRVRDRAGNWSAWRKIRPAARRRG
jgi:hypothetical protein